MQLKCKFRDAKDRRCFLQDNVYAHSTNMAFKDTILRNGLCSMPVQKRIHQCLTEDQKESYCYRNILEEVVDARENNVFLFANFLGAAEHSTYNREKFGNSFKPVIILTDLSGKDVKVDIENFRSMQFNDLKTTPLSTITEWYFQNGSTSTRMPVSVKSPIEPNRIIGWCELNEKKLQRTPNKKKFFAGKTNILDYGFKFDENRAGTKKEYSFQGQYSDKYLKALQEQKQEYWNNVLSKIKPSMDWFYTHELDTDSYNTGLYDYHNWDCYSTTPSF